MAKRSKVYPVQIPPLPLRPGRAPMSRRLRTRLAFGLAGCILAVVAAAVLLAVFQPGEEALLPIGAVAPAFTLRTAAGGSLSLQRLRGRVVLLEFCATWSSRCAAQVPALNRLAAGTRRLPVAVLSVNADSEDQASVATFNRTFHLRVPVLLDPGTTTVTFPTRGPRGPVTAHYRVTTFPTFYVLDPEGRVVWRSPGEQTAAFLTRELRRAVP